LLFLSKISLNKPYLQIIRIIFNDLRRGVWELPVWKSYTVTGTFLKLYITDSVIASKHCVKFRETDELCSSLMHYFTDCKQLFTTVIWQFGKDSSLWNHWRCIFVAPFHNDQRTSTPNGEVRKWGIIKQSDTEICATTTHDWPSISVTGTGCIEINTFCFQFCCVGVGIRIFRYNGLK